VLEYLAQGQQVALISDAGSPLIADPGYRLVRACRKAGYAVRPVPGPSAVLAALMASGLPPLPFIFLGFLPRKPGQQRQLWRQYAQLSCTLIFFERKSRLRETLATAASELGGRELCLARELTKVHEQFIFIQLDKWEGIDPDIRGELTVLIGPPQTQIASQNEVEEYLRRALAQGGRPREIVRNVQGQLPGWTSKSLYQVLMGMQDKG
jgi:16S rRNA (cytidine1402-2'-O)-methyltransferase